MASTRRLTWRQRCEDAASADDLSPVLAQEMLARAVLGTLSETQEGAAHQVAALLDSWGGLQVKLRDASPADEGGFARDVAKQLTALNGGSVDGAVIPWPKAKESAE